MSDAAGIVAGAGSQVIRRATSHYTVELASDWNEAALRLREDLATAQMTPFQHAHWLGAWYDVHRNAPGCTPLIAVVRDGQQHRVLAILPLVMRSQHHARIAEFAGGADYNAPILASLTDGQAIEPHAFWGAVRQALAARGCDVVRFTKMPASIGHLANPFVAHPAVHSCEITGHHLQIPESYEDHRLARERTFRKELERSWRVFTKHEGARFERITDLARALHVFATLEVQQSARMREMGQEYSLDDKSTSDFHRDLITRGLEDGYVVLTALTCGETIVATLLGICIEASYLMVRISNAGGIWSKCSPGRLIIDHTMAALHHEGTRNFDFSVGSYDYKRRFGVSPVPLFDLIAPVNWRGRLMLALWSMMKSVQVRAAALRPQQ